MNPLNVRVLPRRSGSRDHFFDTHVLDALSEELAVDRITITNQKPRRLFIRKRVDDLLSRPFGRRMLGHMCIDQPIGDPVYHRPGGQRPLDPGPGIGEAGPLLFGPGDTRNGRG